MPDAEGAGLQPGENDMMILMRKRTGIVAELVTTISSAEKSGLTRYRLAKLSGVTEGGLSRLVAGENVPKLDTAERILAAMGKRLQIVDT